MKAILPAIYAGTSLRLLALLRDGSDPGVRELAVASTAVAGGSSMIVPMVLDGVAVLTGDANYGRFLSQLCTVVAAGQGEAVLLRSSYGDDAAAADAAVEARRPWMFVTLALMAVLFSGDRAIAAELQVPSDRLHTPVATAYWCAFTAFVAQTAGQVGQLALREARLTNRDSVRVGMRTTAAGALVLAAFYGQYAAAVSGRLVYRRLPGPLRGVPAQAVIGSAAGLIAVGYSLPGVARRWQAARRRLPGSLSYQDIRTYIGLRPVWHRLQEVRRSRSRPVGTLASPAEVRLIGRVLGILDGLHRLAGELDPQGRLLAVAGEVGRQHGLDVEDVMALHRAALMHYAAGAARPDDPDLDDRDLVTFRAPTHPDFREEACRLLRVKTYLRSPLPLLVAQTVVAEAEASTRTMGAMTVPQPSRPGQPQSPDADGPCTCLPGDADSVGYLVYAIGRSQAETAIAEERSKCRVHRDVGRPLAQ